MKDTLKAAIAAAVFSTASFGAGAVWTASAHAQAVLPVTSVRAPGAQKMTRPDERGDRNLLVNRRRLETIIDQLQRDPKDYGGHRETALDLLQKARLELDAAVAYEEQNGSR